MSDPLDAPDDHRPLAGLPALHERVGLNSGGAGLGDEESGGTEAEDPMPWDEDPLEEEQGARVRHDAFTDRRKRKFLAALAKTGSIEDACRMTGVSRRTVYRHQESVPGFFDNCCLAIRMAAQPLEFTAWQRAVEGVEQQFVAGGQVHVRRRYDSGLLRLLLQASNPKKFGPRPGFSRKRILRHERKEMEREIRAEIRAETKRPPISEVTESIVRRIKAAIAHEEPKKLAAGWTKTPKGDWVPPGYAAIPGWEPPAGIEEYDPEGTPHESM